MSKEISYDWDLIWDIKTKEAARDKYARLKADLAKIPSDLAIMEQLAVKDGFLLGDKAQMLIEQLRDIYSQPENYGTQAEWQDETNAVMSELFEALGLAFKAPQQKPLTGIDEFTPDPDTLRDRIEEVCGDFFIPDHARLLIDELVQSLTGRL